MKLTSAFIILFLPWLVLSGKYDAMHIGMGVLCAAMVAWWSKDLLFPNGKFSISFYIKHLFRFIPYMGWLFWQIVLSNVHVLKVALSPRMRELISPKMVRFNTDVTEEISKFVLANSITLTPGTVTVRVEGRRFLVHALTEKAASGLPGESDEMERRIINVFEKDR